MKQEQAQNELTDYALHLVEKDNFLDTVKERISEVKLSSKNIEVKKELTTLQFKIHENVSLQEDRKVFSEKVEQLSDGFYLTLQTRFNNLTQREQRLAALLRLKLSSKEIASILNLTVRSVEQSRYRLKKRLELKKEANIGEFLRTL